MEEEEEEVLGEEEEIELSLGLSIGGGRKFEKKSNNNQKSMISSITIFDFQFCENDTRRIQNENPSSSSSSKPSCCCVCSSLSVDDDDDDGDGDGVLDPEKMRRETHKMRRQEARKKQLQKKKKKKKNVVARKYFDDLEEDGSEQQQICKKKLRSEKEESFPIPPSSGPNGGGNSCETRSHSQSQLNVPVNIQVQSDDLNTSFNPTECSLVFENTNNNIVCCSNDAQSNPPSKTEEKQVPVIEEDPHPIDKPNSVTDYYPLRLHQHSEGAAAYVENFKPQPPRLLKRTNEEARKPFIPEPSHQLTETNGESNLITPKLTQPQTPKSLPRMPCVSTTVGNGPNGKTVTGFLYRYTKTEVSIMCVCHGSSFSPAEFVKHAGGTDVSHPLKDIVVVP